MSSDAPPPRLPRPPERERRAWLYPVIGLGLLTAVALWLFRTREQPAPAPPIDRLESLRREWAAPGQKGIDAAVRDADDADPLVRKAVVQRLVNDATTAEEAPRPVPTGRGLSTPGWGWNGVRSTRAMKRLLADPDRAVRLEALEAVTRLRIAPDFKDQLLAPLRSGPTQERLLVAKTLALWGGKEALDTFADPEQPVEVRLAAMSGILRYGSGAELTLDMARKVAADPDRRMRHAALDAVRHLGNGLHLWLHVALTGDATDRRRAFEVWTAALVEDIYGLTGHPALDDAERFVTGTSGRGKPKAEQKAVIVAVLCRAARLQTERLDKAQRANEAEAFEALRGVAGPKSRAFVEQTARLTHVATPLRVVHRLLFSPDGAIHGETFTARLPDEPESPPPAPRKLRELVAERARTPIAWCRKHRNEFRQSEFSWNGWKAFDLWVWERRDVDGPKVGPKKPWLSDYLDRMEMGSDDAYRKLFDLYKPKGKAPAK